MLTFTLLTHFNCLVFAKQFAKFAYATAFFINSGQMTHSGLTGVDILRANTSIQLQIFNLTSWESVTSRQVGYFVYLFSK